MILSVVIPAHNEVENIPMIIQKVEESIRAVTLIESYEIIICDDHSSDQSFQRVLSLGKENIKAIRLSRRSGSHTAIRAGLSRAVGDAVLCVSADGQDDPNVLHEMINKIKNGKQIVWGVRRNRDEPFFNRKFSELFYRLLSLFVPNENNIELSNADFYLLDRKVVNAINSCQERNTSLFGLIAWVGFKQDQVTYERKSRMVGKSKWNFKSKLKLTMDWIIAFSGIPLRLITILGTAIATLGFFYALLVIALGLFGNTAPGWASTVILILVLGGIQLVMLGVIGEYLWRTLDEGRKRPLFFIEEETN